MNKKLLVTSVSALTVLGVLAASAVGFALGNNQSPTDADASANRCRTVDPFHLNFNSADNLKFLRPFIGPDATVNAGQLELATSNEIAAAVSVGTAQYTPLESFVVRARLTDLIASDNNASLKTTQFGLQEFGIYSAHFEVKTDTENNRTTINFIITDINSTKPGNIEYASREVVIADAKDVWMRIAYSNANNRSGLIIAEFTHPVSGETPIRLAENVRFRMPWGANYFTASIAENTQHTVTAKYDFIRSRKFVCPTPRGAASLLELDN